MKRTGHVLLPLHGGHAPSWLTRRMKGLSDVMVRLIVDEYGSDVFLRRLSNPYWFQAFGCALGFDWHSSGLTTVVTGVLKDTLTVEKHGVRVAGGKGKASRKAQTEIGEIGDELGFSTNKIEGLKYASRMVAKVDTASIQAGYPIYHHTFFVVEDGGWCVVQQGLNIMDKTARRYHWLSEHVKSFVVEPHDAIVGEYVKPKVLNMTAKEAEENRRICVDLARGDPHSLISSIKKLASPSVSLDYWTTGEVIAEDYQTFSMPRDLNWNIFKQLYEVQPRDYEELLAFKGVGPSTVRALALISELIYGKPASWKDPVKFSFAHGGKDGVPFPVDRQTMDESIRMLREVLSSEELGQKDKVEASRRLSNLAKRWGL